eukprot:3201901-Pyramimonas_sp.AAC.1
MAATCLGLVFSVIAGCSMAVRVTSTAHPEAESWSLAVEQRLVRLDVPVDIESGDPTTMLSCAFTSLSEVLPSIQRSTGFVE